MHSLLNIPSKVNNYTLGFVDSISEIENFIDQLNYNRCVKINTMIFILITNWVT